MTEQQPEGRVVINMGTLQNGSALMQRQPAHRLSRARLPDCLSAARKSAEQFKRALEKEVRRQKGQITITDASLIDSCTGHQVHLGICSWLLRERIRTMRTSDIRACSESIANAGERRSRVLKELGLDKQQERSIIATLYAAEKPGAAV